MADLKANKPTQPTAPMCPPPAVAGQMEVSMDQAKKPPTDSTSVFFIGEPGLVAMAVCAPAALTREQIATEVNAKSPTGITSRWTVTEHADLSADEVPVYPVQCPDDAVRRHYMMHC